jgi:hypothetical protein
MNVPYVYTSISTPVPSFSQPITSGTSLTEAVDPSTHTSIETISPPTGISNLDAPQPQAEAAQTLAHLAQEDLFATRSTELQWLSRHPTEAAQLVGQWIALDGDHLVSHGTDLVMVLKAATCAGHPHPFVTMVSSENATLLF